MNKPLLALLLTFTLVLSACTVSPNGSFAPKGIKEFLNNEYSIYDTVSSATNSANFSEIYIAENESIDQVASKLTAFQKPVESSEKKDGKQVLIYENLFIILTEDERNPSNTFIEIANDEFVRNNYSPDFFDGLFLYWVLDEVLDVDDWGKKRKSQCSKNPESCYGGYSAYGGGFKGLNKTPTIRGGSSSIRGGGPGAGK